MSQYPILFDGNLPDDLYLDQGMYHGTIFSAYTSWGIKAIDEQYAVLIRHVGIPVEGVYKINNKREKYLRNGKEYESLTSKISYDLCEFNSGPGLLGICIEWLDMKYDFMFGSMPILDERTRCVDNDALRKQIKRDQHLHPMIKDNLFENLDSYLKLSRQYGLT